MRRISLILLVILAAAVFASAQTKTVDTIKSQIKSLNAEKAMEANYLKDSNLTKVTAFYPDFGKDQDSANNLSAFNFGMAYFFVGTSTTAPPDSFTTTFWAEGRKSTFAQSNALTIIVDGETLDLGNSRYARKSGDPREFLNYVVPRQDVEKIVKGRDVQLKIGATQFKFKPEQMALFKNLLAVSNPAQ